MHDVDEEHEHGAGLPGLPLGGGGVPTFGHRSVMGAAAQRGAASIHDHGEDDDEWFELSEITEQFVYSGDLIELTTVGIDIGSSTSHLIFSKLTLRRLGQHLSSRYVVVSREVLHASPILLTPYTADYTIDAERLGTFIRESYQEAGLTPGQVDTGAIILTGEAVKRTNARAIADLFAAEAGKFVCASAGHNLETVMAAHGSGAVARSREAGLTILNVDVGGGTSKLALVTNGEIVQTAALEVGGRLVALDAESRVTRIEPAARMAAEVAGVSLHLDEVLSDDNRASIARVLADCLVTAMRSEPSSELGKQLWVTPPFQATGPIDVIIWSGGVSEYLYRREQRDFGDLARPLADALQTHVTDGRLPAPVDLSGERIRATVIGASQFTVQVSGNTISITDPDALPIHNLQVLYPRLPNGDETTTEQLQEAITASFQRFDVVEGDQPVALALDWAGTPSYRRLRGLAEGIAGGLTKTIANGLPIVLVFSGDVGKNVGAILREDLGLTNEVVSIDSIEVQELDYIDIGELLLPAKVVPVVIKSLVFPHVVDARAELSRV